MKSGIGIYRQRVEEIFGLYLLSNPETSRRWQ